MYVFSHVPENIKKEIQRNKILSTYSFAVLNLYKTIIIPTRIKTQNISIQILSDFLAYNK